mmetsp:Transcript_22725/g.67307  ORF Transcript_22725/g.67307 Transcript_22725/m.67307 type:complete len:182 (-) Transcript_22725:247-792(-)
MLHARLMVEAPAYRAHTFDPEPDGVDRPLVAQLAGHDASVLLAAGRLVQSHVDAVDINFGCPQGIARKGRYGAFASTSPSWPSRSSAPSPRGSTCRSPQRCGCSRRWTRASLSAAGCKRLAPRLCACMAAPRSRTSTAQARRTGPRLLALSRRSTSPSSQTGASRPPTTLPSASHARAPRR